MLRRIEKVDTEGFFSSFGGRFCIKLFPQIPLKMTFIVMCNVLYTVQCTIYCTLNLTEYIGLPSAVKVTLHSVQFINSNGAGAAVEINISNRALETTLFVNIWHAKKAKGDFIVEICVTFSCTSINQLNP